MEDAERPNNETRVNVRQSFFITCGRKEFYFFLGGGGGEGAAASSLARKESDCVARVGETSVFSI